MAETVTAPRPTASAAPEAAPQTPLTAPAARPRVVYFDLLNVCATLCVIGMHCNNIVHTIKPCDRWLQALVVEVLAYWAVPVFLMLSGATLMRYREKYSTATFFRKRLLRTAVPFLAWSLIVPLINFRNPFEGGVKMFLYNLLNCKFEDVYWFFPAIFSVYLAMPVLSLLADHRRVLWYMFFSSFAYSAVLSPVCTYLDFTWNSNLTMPVMGGYLMYVVLGYLLATTDLKPVQRGILYGLGVFGAGLRYVMVAVLSFQDGKKNFLFFNYRAYFTVFLAVAIFVLFKYWPLNRVIGRSARACRLLQTLSSCSLGVYLVHMPILDALKRLIPDSPWYWRTLMPVAIYLIALAIVYGLKQIPGVRRLVP